MRRHPRTSAAAIVYRLALRALPRHFRARFGREMNDLLMAQLTALDRRRDRIELLALAVLDALRQGVDERFRGVRSINQSPASAAYEAAPRSEVSMLERTRSDIHFSMRSLRRNPGFTVLAVLTLAFGIGANTAMFTVIDGILLEPLPYAAPDRLVRIFEHTPRTPEFPVAPGNFVDYREELRGLDGIAAFTRGDAELSAGDAARRLDGMRVSSGFLALLGRPPILGRDIARSDEQGGAPPVVVLGHALWRTRFESDESTLGSRIELDGVPHTVIGVAPPGLEHVGGRYRSLPQGTSIDVWRPMELDGDLPRNQHFLNAIGRLREGVGVDRLQTELAVLTARLEADHPDTNTDWRAHATSLHQDVVGEIGGMLWLLLGAAFLVLAVVCANIANLVLARGVGRRKEVAMRAALGASRGRLFQQLLTENILLATVAGALGSGIAFGVVALIRRFGPADIPRLHALEVDLSALLFCLAVSVATGVFVGCLPALRLSRAAMIGWMQTSGRGGSSRSATRARSALVSAQVALAVILLVGAGLLLRSFANVLTEPSGFQPDGAIAGSIELPAGRYPTVDEQRRFWSRLIPALEDLPGVEAIGAGSDLPWTGHDENLGMRADGGDGTPRERISVRYHQATPGYFAALGIPLLAGRSITADDLNSVGNRLMINERLAGSAWPERSPAEVIGRRLTWSPEPDDDDWFTVVGVVGNVKDGPTATTTLPAIYFPYDQQPWTRKMYVAARADGAVTGSLFEGIRRVLREIDGDLPFAEVTHLERVAAGPLGRPRFISVLVTAFAMITLGFAVVGLGSVIAFTVSQRRREAAVRMALGASVERIVRMFMWQGLRALLIGIALGAIGALLSGQFLESLLFGVEPRDPRMLLAVGAILIVVGAAASLIPALRASRIEPSRMLGSD